MVLLRIILTCLLLRDPVRGFLPSFDQRQQSQYGKRTNDWGGANDDRPYSFIYQHSSKKSGDDEEDNADDLPVVGPEKSRMVDFVARYLGKTPNPSARSGGSKVDFSSEVLDTSTHLIAIPMDTCHELLLELESVQRAILYHCPILVDACVPPAMTRLPLLYVRAPQATSARVTTVLAGLLKTLVQKLIFETQKDDVLSEEELMNEDLLNVDGHRPFTMTFQSLEIDGSNNNILNTVGKKTDSGTKKLAALVQGLQTAIEAEGWETAFPPDPTGGVATTESSDEASSSPSSFRPRISFMELPKEFNDNLSRFKDKDTEIDDEVFEFLTADQGGNGISPIFWCQWWDDVFGHDIRLKEIGVYPRHQQLPGSFSAPSDLSYSLFYLPYETIALPDGNPAMLRNEQKFQQYQDERLEEQQQQQQTTPNPAIDIDATTVSSPATASESSNANTRTNPNQEPDFLMTKTRERLEQLYMSSGDKNFKFGKEDTSDSDDKVATEEVNAEGTQTKSEVSKDESSDDDEEVDLGLSPNTASPDDFIDDWMESRIRKVVESQESVKSRIPVKKDKPPIADNPVFKAFKDGTLVPKEQRVKPAKKKLPPYPSREHFAGIWRVVTSPTGFPAEHDSTESSENLVLRIDGTTAGGPILNPETKQKAAGGTWKMIEDDDGDVKLRIRLVIPPEKCRVIEMTGLVNRMKMSPDIPMASKAFGVPYLEEMAKEANKSDMEDIMHCGGDVFMEDNGTRKNRESIGTFSLMKLQGPKGRGEYTITIPKPTRNQD